MTRTHEDPEVPRPLHERIAADLRKRIYSGEYGPGAQLPTERELAEAWSAARGTVRRATESLRNEGLVIGNPPLGVFVRSRRRIVVRPQEEFGRHFASLTDFFVDQVRGQAGEPSQIIKVEHIRPPAVVAERLRTGDAVVVARMRIRSVDGERYDLNDSYYPRDVVEGTEAMSPDDVTRGVNRLLDEHGHRQVLVVDELIARMPTKVESDLLELPPGTPVLEQIVTGYIGDEPDSRPVRCTVTLFPGDRYRLVYERRRPGQK